MALMRVAGFVLLLALVGCTVAVDDFERCEAPAFSVEPQSCVEVVERDCTLTCLRTVPDQMELTTCLQSCGPADSPCLECIFGITAECTVDVCAESYQDLSCCALERCGELDFECAACPDEITAFNTCAERVTREDAVCGAEVLRCYED